MHNTAVTEAIGQYTNLLSTNKKGVEDIHALFAKTSINLVPYSAESPSLRFE